MKKNLIFILLAIAAIGGYLTYSYFSSSTMKMAKTIEEPSLSIEVPKAFTSNYEAGSYVNEDNMMFVEFNYYPNYLGMTPEAMLYSTIYMEFYSDAILSVEQVTIDGEDVWQAEYRTLTTGIDGIHYYYSGLLTAFELDKEIVIVDVYQAMNEAEGIDSVISEKEMQLLKDITATVKITDAGYENVTSTAKKFECDSLNLALWDDWHETTEDENGYYDFGYFASYTLQNTSVALELYEYNEENKNTEDDLVSAPDNYEFLGNIDLGGETAYLYAYDAYSSDDVAPYYYGIIAISEHYWVDFYFVSYFDEYEMPDDTKDAIVNLLSSVK